MKFIKHSIKKVLILAVGGPLFVLGLILIPLPGPGLLVSLIALFILSLEFEFAEKPLNRSKDALNAIIKKSFDKYKQIDKK